MKRIKTSILTMLGMVILTAFAFLCGCETDSAAQRIEVRPDTAMLRYRESVTLTAYNGYIYDWTIQDDSMGVLNSRRGMMVTYTSISDPTSPQVQVITVTSTFSDSDSGSSSSPVSHTAQAYITHIPATSDLVTASSTP